MDVEIDKHEENDKLIESWYQVIRDKLVAMGADKEGVYRIGFRRLATTKEDKNGTT